MSSCFCPPSSFCQVPLLLLLLTSWQCKDIPLLYQSSYCEFHFHLFFVRAPPDGYLPAVDDSLGSYEGSGGEEEGGGRAAAGSGEEEEGEVEGSLDGYQGSASGEEEGIQFDLPEYTDDADNLVEAENVAEETTENPTEDITEEPIENNLVEGEEDPAAKNAGETFQAPPPAGPDDIPEGDPANLPDVPPGPKVRMYLSDRNDKKIFFRTWQYALEARLRSA